MIGNITIDSDHYRASFRRRRSDFIWVTFGYWGQQHDYYWGQEVAEYNNYSFLGIVDKGYSWYATVSEIFPLLLPILDQYQIRIGSGVSMGGYAAIKYSRALRFEATLAVVPQFSINPSSVNDFRYKDWFNPALFNMDIKAEDIGGKIYTLIDPHYELDMAHYRRLTEVIVPVQIPAHYCGHFSIAAYLGRDRMGRVISALLDGDLAALRKYAREGRKASADRAAGIICAAWSRDRRRGRKLFKLYKEKTSSYRLQDTLAELSREMTKLGNRDVALETMKEALNLIPENHFINYQYSNLIHELDPNTALACAEKAAQSGEARFIAWRDKLRANHEAIASANQTSQGATRIGDEIEAPTAELAGQSGEEVRDKSMKC